MRLHQLLRERADAFGRYVEKFLDVTVDDELRNAQLSDDVVSDEGWWGRLAVAVDDVTLVFDPPAESTFESDLSALRVIAPCLWCDEPTVVDPPVSSWESLGDALVRGRPTALHDCSAVPHGRTSSGG